MAGRTGLGTKIVVTIEDIALPNNYGVAKVGGFVFFVPDTVPGDCAEIAVRKTGKRFSFGEVISLREPSPFRTDPPCPHFGRCGGCTLQHTLYGKQLDIKETHLKETLKRMAGIAAADSFLLPIVPSLGEYDYRSKVELAFGHRAGRLILGYKERVSPFKGYENAIVPVEGCLLFGPSLTGIMPASIEAARRIWGEASPSVPEKGFLRRLVVRQARSTGQIMVILETGPAPARRVMAALRDLATECPVIDSLYWTVSGDPSCGGAAAGARHISGNLYIEENLGGLAFRVYPKSFAQPNTLASELLYREIAARAGGERTGSVLGLYCGTGPIELFLSRATESVTGIDEVEENILAARENCRINGIDNCLFQAGKVESLPGKLHGKSFDLVVVDPPRTGIDKKGVDLIGDIRAPRVFYVSCEPSTLARDLKTLLDRRYAVETIIPFDFFPQTAHMETLAILRRR